MLASLLFAYVIAKAINKYRKTGNIFSSRTFVV